MFVDQEINNSFDEYKNDVTGCNEESFKDYFSFDSNLICKLFEIMKNKMIRTNGWNEDAVTEAIVDGLMDTLDSQFDLNVYKQIGIPENYFGDIAFIVTFNLDNGTSFSGVSFIEAKRDYKDNRYRFNEFKKAQMKRFIDNTSSSYYLLYSHKLFLPIVDTFYLDKLTEKFNIDDRQLKIEHLVSPILPITFISQIERFLNGYDLDYSKQALLTVNGKNSNTGLPLYIIQISKSIEGIAPEPTPTPDGTPPFKPDLNKYEKYEKESESNIKNSIGNKNVGLMKP